MTRVHVSADYDASPDTVWQALEVVDSHVDWMADAETIRFLTEQTSGVGTRFECITKVGPIRLTGLAPGEFRPLRPEEIRRLYKAAGL